LTLPKWVIITHIGYNHPAPISQPPAYLETANEIDCLSEFEL
jgi:hypothetical protein